MKYQHRFRVQAPVQAVAEFHNRSAAMAAITPPPILVQVHRAPERLDDGREMDFTMWLGPLPVPWTARFEEVTPTSFVDRMVRGPLRVWRHRHSFVAVDPRTTDVVDEVDVELRAHPVWGPVGLGMWLNLPVLFAYRAWQTRRLLERPAAGGSLDVALAQASQQSRSLAVLTLGAAVALLAAGLGIVLSKRRR